jgi:hypothetical protein
MSYYDDYYEEPNEFEMQIEEFKDSLKKAVKQEYQQEIESLRKENESLREIKNNFEKIKREYAQKENELEFKKRDLANQVRRERLSSLMIDFQVILYSPKTIRQILPKCNKCDDKRQIHFKSPSGKDMTESCECDKKPLLYRPLEYRCHEFKLDSYKNNNSLCMWFKEHKEKDYDYYTDTTYVDYIYRNDKTYDELLNMKKSIFFRNIEECQKYCDWLNNKHGYTEI